MWMWVLKRLNYHKKIPKKNLIPGALRMEKGIKVILNQLKLPPGKPERG
jgi:hypothetical protein